MANSTLIVISGHHTKYEKMHSATGTKAMKNLISAFQNTFMVPDLNRMKLPEGKIEPVFKAYYKIISF